jgi:hypothetical protein
MQRYTVEFVVRAEVSVPGGFNDEDVIARIGADIINQAVKSPGWAEPVVFMSNLLQVIPGINYKCSSMDESIGDLKGYSEESLKKIP